MVVLHFSTHPLFLYNQSFSNLSSLRGSWARTPPFSRSKHSHGTCRPEERPSARTATFSGNRGAQEHDSDPGKRAARSEGRPGEVSGDRSRGGAAERVSGLGREERIAHAAREEALRDRQGAAGHRD